MAMNIRTTIPLSAAAMIVSGSCKKSSTIGGANSATSGAPVGDRVPKPTNFGHARPPRRYSIVEWCDHQMSKQSAKSW
jgi:hypothetical protein